MASVFAIASGAYSDYQIHLVCETREQAENAVSEMGGDYEVEEFDYFAKGEGPGVHVIYEARGIEGTMDVDVHSWRQFGEAPRRPAVRQEPWRGAREAHPVYVEARCRDRDAAVKAVAGRLAALKAAGDWLPPDDRDLELLRLSRPTQPQ